METAMIVLIVVLMALALALALAGEHLKSLQKSSEPKPRWWAQLLFHLFSEAFPYALLLGIAYLIIYGCRSHP